MQRYTTIFKEDTNQLIKKEFLKNLDIHYTTATLSDDEDTGEVLIETEISLDSIKKDFQAKKWLDDTDFSNPDDFEVYITEHLFYYEKYEIEIDYYSKKADRNFELNVLIKGIRSKNLVLKFKGKNLYVKGLAYFKVI